MTFQELFHALRADSLSENVSMQTLEIVNSRPKLNFEKEDNSHE